MKHLKYIALILFVWLGAACEQLPLPNTELTIKSEIVTEVTANSAVIEVEFNPTAATIQNVYACYTSTEKTVMKKVADLKYRVNLLALDNNTEYHVHYMVTNSFSSVTLQNNLSFTTAVNKPSNVIDTVYHIDFTQTMGAWTIKNYLLSGGLTYVWARTDKYGMKASAFLGTNHASEAWLISSPLDLTSNTTAFLTFNQAYKYGDISQFAVKITKNGLDWITLEVPTWPDGTSWDFINSGEIDITKYISATTQIAFAYTSSAEASPTWEIRDVLIKGNGTRIEEPTASVTPEYVDLGLSVKWATFNVGAIKPEGYGDYFAWGEVEPKEVYDWSTYKWCNGSESTLTKYCTDSYYGTIDNKTVLEAADDVAAVKWGSTWRMPTDAELLELHTECIWTWTTLNGVDGYKVTGTNGNSIFLPAAGYCGDSSFYGVGIHGYYWSNSLDTNGPRYAWRVNFHSSNVGRRSNRRDYGYSVRPVYGPQSEQTTAPTVVTSAMTQITETTAVAGGNVTSDGGTSSTERGVVYSTNPNPVITNLSNTILPCGSGAGSFTCNLTGLQPNTTYYIRAYAKNDVGTAYGEQVTFTTLADVNISEPTGTENSYGYVDLGLSVKWATFNVGATKPEDYGDYFAWGETEPKDVYYESTYKWCNGSGRTLTKYCTDSYYGTIDNKTVLEAIDDVAAVKWGGNWRMPTVTELTELREQCTWTWTTHNGVNGYKVTSNSNGNSIFLPAAGLRDTGSHNLIGIYGGYWSNTLNMGRVVGAYTVHCNSNGVIELNDFDRWYGLSVRPVYGPQSEQTTAPTVVTSAVTQITETSAVVGGNVTSDGGASVTERGVVYSTNPNPVITNLSNTILPCGSGAGSFTCNLTGLQPNTTYYIRAYAKNDVGTAYGEEMSFTTQTQIQKPTTPYFSVSETKNVTFSPGNLQYHPANNEWRFAPSQLDYIGDANSNCSSTYNGWLDLFGWSTSATNFGVSTSIDDADYSGSLVDWGTNTIGNDAPNTWRTLTEDEWEYLLNTRPNASSLKGVAQVNGVNGLILLPDNWTCPAGVTFKSGFHSEEGVEYYAAYQTFTADQWSKLEAAGAVFLPAAGDRYGSDVYEVQYYSGYWSATEYYGNYAYFLYFRSDDAYMYNYYRNHGLSVRLVKDL